jgi:cytidylate kinase
MCASSESSAVKQAPMRPSIIAVDGPVASGKSTIGGLLAEKLGYVFFDTGAMYRAVTRAALDRGVALDDESSVTALAQHLVIDVLRPTADDGRQYTVLSDGQDVTWEIRQPDVVRGVSVVSAYPGVRSALTATQRRIGIQGQIVMVGRDIGTVVLPDADLKIYLDASAEERARRRYDEIISRGETAKFQDVLASVRRRDQIDSGRAVAPLQAADDAIVIDTTGLDVAQVLDRVVALVDGRRAKD